MAVIGISLEDSDITILDKIAKNEEFGNRSAVVKRLLRKAATERYEVVKVEEHPHPADGEVVPLVTISPRKAKS